MFSLKEAMGQPIMQINQRTKKKWNTTEMPLDRGQPPITLPYYQMFSDWFEGWQAVSSYKENMKGKCIT